MLQLEKNPIPSDDYAGPMVQARMAHQDPSYSGIALTHGDISDYTKRIDRFFHQCFIIFKYKSFISLVNS
jgi:hypothetical protein